MSALYLQRLHIAQLRCLSQAELCPAPDSNIIYGDNGAGKTSILEGIYLLSRGQSFRSTPNRQLIRDGESYSLLRADLRHGEGDYRLAMQRGADGAQLQLNRERQVRQASFARLLPVLIVDPGQHRLLEDGPMLRRRFLDWSVFHVEPSYLRDWQRYRRALLQRNALLRQGDRQSLASWDEQFVTVAEAVANKRGIIFGELKTRIDGLLAELFDTPPNVDIRYRRGWARDSRLQDLLAQQRGQDLERGFTQSGPHRAELRVSVDRHAARDSLSRGQQKLVMCAMLFGQARHFQERLGQAPILLVDDLASELGEQSRMRLLTWLNGYPGQRFMTALAPDALGSNTGARMFHVKHGVLQPG